MRNALWPKRSKSKQLNTLLFVHTHTAFGRSHALNHERKLFSVCVFFFFLRIRAHTNRIADECNFCCVTDGSSLTPLSTISIYYYL